jgi:hypothetical protein
MHYVIRIYTVDPKDVDEIFRRAETGFAPLISKEPGFVSYRGAVTDDGRGVTVTVFESKAGAEASTSKAAAWVKESGLAGLLPNAPEVISGEALFRHINPQASMGYGIMRRYKIDPKNLAEIMRRVESGLVPVVTGAPGFAAYVGLDAGNGDIVSLNGFRDKASAEASNAAARAWVQANLADLTRDPPQVTGMAVRFSKVK